MSLYEKTFGIVDFPEIPNELIKYNKSTELKILVEGIDICKIIDYKNISIKDYDNIYKDYTLTQFAEMQKKEKLNTNIQNIFNKITINNYKEWANDINAMIVEFKSKEEITNNIYEQLIDILSILQISSPILNIVIHFIDYLIKNNNIQFKFNFNKQFFIDNIKQFKGDDDEMNNKFISFFESITYFMVKMYEMKNINDNEMCEYFNASIYGTSILNKFKYIYYNSYCRVINKFLEGFNNNKYTYDYDITIHNKIIESLINYNNSKKLNIIKIYDNMLKNNNSQYTFYVIQLNQFIKNTF